MRGRTTALRCTKDTSLAGRGAGGIETAGRARGTERVSDSGRGQRARLALALAAGLQGRYLDAHLALMEREDGFGDEVIDYLADALGLDAARLNQLIDEAGQEALRRRRASPPDLGGWA